MRRSQRKQRDRELAGKFLTDLCHSNINTATFRKGTLHTNLNFQLSVLTAVKPILANITTLIEVFIDNRS